MVTASGADTEHTVTVGQAVHFRFRDPILGTQLEQAGLVVAVSDEAVSVAPVAPFTVLVPAGDVQPLTAPAVPAEPARSGSSS